MKSEKLISKDKQFNLEMQNYNKIMFIIKHIDEINKSITKDKLIRYKEKMLTINIFYDTKQNLQNYQINRAKNKVQNKKNKLNINLDNESEEIYKIDAAEDYEEIYKIDKAKDENLSLDNWKYSYTVQLQNLLQEDYLTYLDKIKTTIINNANNHNKSKAINPNTEIYKISEVLITNIDFCIKNNGQVNIFDLLFKIQVSMKTIDLAKTQNTEQIASNIEALQKHEVATSENFFIYLNNTFKQLDSHYLNYETQTSTLYQDIIKIQQEILNQKSPQQQLSKEISNNISSQSSDIAKQHNLLNKFNDVNNFSNKNSVDEDISHKIKILMPESFLKYFNLTAKFLYNKQNSIFYEQVYFATKNLKVKTFEYFNFYNFFYFAFKNNANILIKSPKAMQLDIKLNENNIFQRQLIKDEKLRIKLNQLNLYNNSLKKYCIIRDIKDVKVFIKQKNVDVSEEINNTTQQINTNLNSNINANTNIDLKYKDYIELKENISLSYDKDDVYLEIMQLSTSASIYIVYEYYMELELKLHEMQVPIVNKTQIPKEGILNNQAINHNPKILSQNTISNNSLVEGLLNNEQNDTMQLPKLELVELINFT